MYKVKTKEYSEGIFVVWEMLNYDERGVGDKWKKQIEIMDKLLMKKI